MKQEVVRIEILSKDVKSSEELKYAIIKESEYFEEKIDIIRKIEELHNVNNVNILMIIIDKELKKILKENLAMLKDKVNKVILIDKDKNILPKEFNMYKNIKITSGIKDNRVIAFSVLYDYYKELKNKREKNILKDQSKKLEKTMDKFEQGENKIVIFDKIDEIVMENRKNNSIGYEKLKIMIYFCIINKLHLDDDKNYNYFHKAIARIFNEKVNVILNEINSSINLIRKRKKQLKIQKYLEEIKGKQVIEQIILISEVVEKNIK